MLATYKDNFQKKGIFGNLLDDGVRDWYDSLQIADKEYYKKMSAACISVTSPNRTIGRKPNYLRGFLEKGVMKFGEVAHHSSAYLRGCYLPTHQWPLW